MMSGIVGSTARALAFGVALAASGPAPAARAQVGRIVHDAALFVVEHPSGSTSPWDPDRPVRRVPAAEITPPEGSTGCRL